MPFTYSTEVDTDNQFDWATIQTMFEDGILYSTYTTFDNGKTEFVRYTDDNISTIIEEDSPDNLETWGRIITTFQEDGQVASRQVFLDDGTSTFDTFSDGVPVVSLQNYPDDGNFGALRRIQTHYDSDGEIDRKITGYHDDRPTVFDYYTDGARTTRVLEDRLDSRTWELRQTDFDDNGQIDARFTTFDNGVMQTEEFTDGQRDSLRKVDEDDVASWDTIETSYDADGQITDRETIYDNGVYKLEEFENGIRSETSQYDNVDGGDLPTEGFGAEVWHEIRSYYDEGGVITGRDTLLDNGVYKLEEFENGIRSETSQYDNVDGGALPTEGFGAEAWHSIVTYFDTDGQIAERQTTFDNGVQKLETFEEGVRAFTYQQDLEDGQGGATDWDQKLNIYDETGTLLSALTEYDDGDRIIFNYEDGEKSERVRVDGDDDETWLLSVTTYSDTGNETVNYDTVDDVPVEYFEYLDLFAV